MIIHPLALADQICEAIPVVSTIANLFNIIQKCALKILKAFGLQIKNSYYKYMDEQKSFARCFAGLVPGLTHLIITIENKKLLKDWGAQR